MQNYHKKKVLKKKKQKFKKHQGIESIKTPKDINDRDWKCKSSRIKIEDKAINDEDDDWKLFEKLHVVKNYCL